MASTDQTVSSTVFYDVATLDPDVVARRTDELVPRLTWPRERLVAYQKEKLAETLRRAAAESPYFRETIGRLVAQDAPLSAYPTMNKSILMSEFDRIVTDPTLTRALVEEHVASDRSGQLLLGKYRVAATGGSTGQRGVFVYDQVTWEMTAANLRRIQRLTGLPLNPRFLGIGAPSPVHISNRLYAEARAVRPDAPCLFVTSPIEEVVEALNRDRPDVVSTYPSFIRRLAEEQVAGRLKIAPIAMRSVAEALSPDVREIARAVWNIPVFNAYASTEAGSMATECRHMSGMHLFDDMLVVEVVDDRNQPVPPGVAGSKVLVTTLYNRTLPIIRYEFSDIVTLIEGPCPCGCPFQRIKDIDGRQEEMLQVWTPSGRQVQVHAPRFWFHLVRVAGLRQYQFTQLPKGIAIRVVPNPGCDQEAVRRSVASIARVVLSELGAADGHLEVHIVDSIARSGAGAKQKLVESAAAGTYPGTL
jgi:putative adenylate-forming enzyme